jgi:hypothetical protein
MINNISIKQPIFLFDTNKNYIKEFKGIVDAESELKISHDIIKKHINTKISYKNYYFSYHRLFK